MAEHGEELVLAAIRRAQLLRAGAGSRAAGTEQPVELVADRAVALAGGSLQPLEHVLEGRGQLPHLVAALQVQALAQIRRADLLRRARDGLDRTQGTVRQPKAATRRTRGLLNASLPMQLAKVYIQGVSASTTDQPKRYQNPSTSVRTR